MAKPQKTFDIAATGAPAKGRGPLWVIAVVVALVAVALFAWMRSRPPAPVTAGVADAVAAAAGGSGVETTTAASSAAPAAAEQPPSPPAPAAPSNPLQATAHFSFGGADVDAAELEAFVAGAAAGGGGILTIGGHTDDVGEENVNQILSDARAQAVETWLKGRGLPAAVEVRTTGFGESQPLCTEGTAECRAQNRRAELVLERR